MLTVLPISLKVKDHLSVCVYGMNVLSKGYFTFIFHASPTPLFYKASINMNIYYKYKLYISLCIGV